MCVVLTQRKPFKNHEPLLCCRVEDKQRYHSREGNNQCFDTHFVGDVVLVTVLGETVSNTGKGLGEK